MTSNSRQGSYTETSSKGEKLSSKISPRLQGASRRSTRIKKSTVTPKNYMSRGRREALNFVKAAAWEKKLRPGINHPTLGGQGYLRHRIAGRGTSTKRRSRRLTLPDRKKQEQLLGH